MDSIPGKKHRIQFLELFLSQTSMVLTANIFWNQIMEDYPEAFGEVNPWNDKIKEIQQKNLGYHTCDADPEQ